MSGIITMLTYVAGIGLVSLIAVGVYSYVSQERNKPKPTRIQATAKDREVVAQADQHIELLAVETRVKTAEAEVTMAKAEAQKEVIGFATDKIKKARDEGVDKLPKELVEGVADPPTIKAMLEPMPEKKKAPPPTAPFPYDSPYP